MQVHENVFPIICENNECDKEYALSDLKEIFLLWGFIYLENDREKLIGITCPHCHYTTIKKCHIDTTDFSLAMLHQEVVEGTRFNPARHKVFVPFSARWLVRNHLILDPNLEKKTKQTPFTVPSRLHKIGGYESFYRRDDAYSVYEENIPILLGIENNQNYKVFSRHVDYFTSIYYKTASCSVELYSMPRIGIIPSTMLEAICKDLDSVVRCAPPVKTNTDNPPSPSEYTEYRSKYNYKIQNDLTLKERHAITHALTSDKKSGWGLLFKKNPGAKNRFYIFLKEFNQLRNRKYFELTCHTDLFNKLARELFDREISAAEEIPIHQDVPSGQAPAQPSLNDFDTNKKEKKPRPSAIDKKRCQEVARKLWKQDPTIKITPMSKKQEVRAACGNSYEQRTIRGWIRELAPSHEPGRPKKDK